eukprot:SAG11_NODE_4665_length_1816_cov_1.063483_1_plen_51_part_00
MSYTGNFGEEELRGCLARGDRAEAEASAANLLELLAAHEPNPVHTKFSTW